MAPAYFMRDKQGDTQQMNIIVVGAGYVGLTTACCLANSKHRVTCVETNKAKLKLLEQGLSPIRENGINRLLKQGLASDGLSFAPSLPKPLQVDIAMITVGTPSLPNGAAALSYVYYAAQELRNATEQDLILAIKSTVPPGTGARLIKRYFENTPITYVSNPEFLREGQAIWDWYHPSRIVIGAEDKQTADKIRQLYFDIDAPVVLTDITSAETIKYASNAFLVTKISFINEIANLCEAVDANIDGVTKGIGLDPRIGPDFLHAGLGYGGSCFPKDARALDSSALNKGYDFRLLKATIEANTRQRIMAIHKLKQALGDLAGKEIALLGLAFKPDTDDIREAPFLDIIHLLYEEGVKLRIYDPKAMENARPLLPTDITFAPDLHSATTGANAVVLVTEWQEFIQADWQSIKEQMQEPYVILDGRNALAQNKLIGLGFRYIGIGRRVQT